MSDFKDYVVIWFTYAKASNYDLPKCNTRNLYNVYFTFST